MTDKPLLLIMNPRYLPECLLSLEQINAPKVWLKNYTEVELETVIPEVIDSLPQYNYFIIVSDDVIASTDAYNAVWNQLEYGHPVVTGYCNLDPVTEYVSLTKTPPHAPYGTIETYDWHTLSDVLDRAEKTDVIRTYHPSMAMTGMSREMWKRFPWHCHGRNGTTGWAADLDLSIRLVEADIPIVAPRNAFMYHTKPDWKSVDSNIYARRALRVGKQPAEVMWDL